MASASFLHLDDYTIEHIFKYAKPNDLYKIARCCPRFRDICVGLWRRCSKQLDCIYGLDEEISFEDYTFYICAMAEHIHSLRLYTSDIAAFSDACKALKELHNLKVLRLVNVYCTEELLPIEFITRCPALEQIQLCQPLLEAFLPDILKVPALQQLEVMRLTRKFDPVMKSLIDAKAEQLKRLEVPVDVFPPTWLTAATMAKCNQLEDLLIETRFAEVAHQLSETVEMPHLSALKTLKIVGTKFCQVQLIQLILNCPNLEELVFYYNKDMDMSFLTELVELRDDRKINKPLLCQHYTEFRKSTRRYQLEVLDDLTRFCLPRNMAEIKFV